jgi:serine/threonine protein kinase
MIKDILKTLSILHTNNIIHGDIKLKNFIFEMFLLTKNSKLNFIKHNYYNYIVDDDCFIIYKNYIICFKFSKFIHKYTKCNRPLRVCNSFAQVFLEKNFAKKRTT